MFDTFILLTGPIEAAALSTVVRFRNPRLTIRPIASLGELNALDGAVLARSRLVAFATAVIVPTRVLEALGFGAYNFHPGSPQYPGWAPSSFALYEGASTFGATAHAMLERVDAGPIVGVETFVVPPHTPLGYLDELSLILLARLFWNLSEALTTQEAPLAVLPVAWCGRKRSRSDYRDMCDVPEGVSADELDRRIAAFGRGDYGYDLTVTLHGHRLRYVVPEAEAPQAIIKTPAAEPVARRA